MTADESAEDRAAELDGPGAIVSHVEVLVAWRERQDVPGIADALGVSASTVRRSLARLRRAELLAR